jgi:mannose-1-phosphate guanylyltransferase/phosphomannomutase
MKAVVMAGGEGTRLRPLTSNLPKPMVPIVNKPVIEHIIDLLIKHDIRDIIVTLYYLPDEIVSFLGDGSQFGVRISYSVEFEPLGTAGSVKQVEDELDDTFLIISGDALTDFNLSEIIAYHKKKKSVATITLTRVENPLEFGVVITDPDGRIRRFLEKPGWGEVFSDTINTGIYVLEPKIFKYIEAGKMCDFSKELFPRLMHQNEPMFGYVAEGYWCDIGNLQQYRQAQYDVLDGRVKVNIPGVRARRDVWIGEGASIDPKAEIQGPTVIGRNCIIKEKAILNEYTVIGDNCIVEEGAVVHRSVLWANTYVGKKSKITGATISNTCTIKSNVLISEGAVIGDKCYVGPGAAVHSQVKIWPEKHVEAGANVNMSLVWGPKWPGNLFGSQGITGLANIEITPEFAMKLGAAYGASLEKGSYVITSRDSHPASRMINRAIICGLISVGVNALDYRFMPTPVSRYGIKMAQAKGGVHVRLSPTEPHAFLIEFFDAEGINIDRGYERKIENIFFREDFRRTAMEEVGTIEFSSRAIDQYIEGFHANVDASAIRKANLKVVVDYGFGNASLVLPHLLGKLGINVVALNAYTDPIRGRQTGKALSQSLKELANIVVTLNANIGLWVDVDGEKIVLIDEKGHVISGYALLNLLLSLVLKYRGGGTVVVPVSAPSTVEKICSSYNGIVKRVKRDPRSLMAEALMDKKVVIAGDGEGGFIFPKFLPTFDAMYSFAEILEVMAKTQEPLSTVVDEIPPFYMAFAKVECAWSEKGGIMRKIIEESRGERLELLDGVKIFLDSNTEKWVLIVPDPVEPLLHLVAEGRSQEEAQSIVQEYEKKLSSLRAAGGVPQKRELEFFKGSEIMARKVETKKGNKKEAVKSSTLTSKNEKGQMQVSPEKAFYFWSDDHFLGVRASSLEEFAKVLEEVDPTSIRYHLSRGDFQNWLTNELEEPALAEALNKVDANQSDLEALRKEVLKLVKS